MWFKIEYACVRSLSLVVLFSLKMWLRPDPPENCHLTVKKFWQFSGGSDWDISCFLSCVFSPVHQATSPALTRAVPRKTSVGAPLPPSCPVSWPLVPRSPRDLSAVCCVWMVFICLNLSLWWIYPGRGLFKRFIINVLFLKLFFLPVCCLSGMVGLAPKWVRLAPNGTNPGLFQIRFQCIWHRRGVWLLASCTVKC